MNGAQLHLALNHIPIVLTIVTLVILLWAWFSKNIELKKLGLVLTIITSVFAGAAFLTGEPAEEVLEKLPVFSKELVHDHEEAGELALIVSIIAGVSALTAFYLNKKKNNYVAHVTILTIVLLLFSSFTFLRAAHLGGFIRHEEIRSP